MWNAKRWATRLRWGFVIAIVIANAAILANVWTDGRAGADGWAEAIDRGFLFLVLAILSVMVLGLLLHFLGSLRRPAVPPDSGEVVLQLQGSRGGSVAMLIALLVLGAAVAYGLDLQRQGDAFDHAEPLTLEWRAVIAFFSVVWALLLLVSVVRAVRNPPWFVLTGKGFVYQPGDVSAGLIRWEDVVDIKEDQVLSASGSGGPILRTALVVVLRDGERYVARYNPVLAAVVRRATGALRAQTGGSGDLYLDPAHFGARYDEVKALMIDNATRPR